MCQNSPDSGKGCLPPAVGPSFENWINHLHCKKFSALGIADFYLTPDSTDGKLGVFSQVYLDVFAFRRAFDTSPIFPNWNLPPDEPFYTEGTLEVIDRTWFWQSTTAVLASGDKVWAIHDFSSAPTPLGKPSVEVVFERSAAVPNKAVGGWNIQVRGRAINPANWDSSWNLAVKKKIRLFNGVVFDSWVWHDKFSPVGHKETICDTLAINALSGIPSGHDANGEYFEIMWVMVDPKGNFFGFEKGKAYVTQNE